MRLDVFLKLSRLISRRTLAKEFAKAGLVSVNGIAAKASREMSIGDEIEIKRHDRITKVKVVKVPATKQVSKKDSSDLYEVVSEEIISEDSIFETGAS